MGSHASAATRGRRRTPVDSLCRSGNPARPFSGILRFGFSATDALFSGGAAGVRVFRFAHADARRGGCSATTRRAAPGKARRATRASAARPTLPSPWIRAPAMESVHLLELRPSPIELPAERLDL